MSEKLNSLSMVTALKSLTQAQTKVLMFHLGVPLNDLDDIEARRGATCAKIYFVERWLDAEIEASWEKLANGLIAMGKTVLANEIRSNSVHSPSTSLQKTPPHSMTQDDSSVLINLETLARAIDEAFQQSRLQERQENVRRMNVIGQELRYKEYSVDHCRIMMRELMFQIQTQNVEIQTLNIRTQCRVSYDELETFIWRIPPPVYYYHQIIFLLHRTEGL